MPTSTEPAGGFDHIKRFLDQLADILQNQVARLLLALAGLIAILKLFIDKIKDVFPF